MRELVMHRGVYPDYGKLGPRLRGIDKLECRATSGLDPVAALQQSVRLSSKWWIGTIDGQEEVAVGVCPMPECDGWGQPWLLSTDKVFHGPPLKQFLRRTPEFLAEASEGFDALFNIVSEHNYASRRWLRYAGFKIKEQDPHVFRGYRFLEFIYVVPGGCYDIDYTGIEHVRTHDSDGCHLGSDGSQAGDGREA